MGEESLITEEMKKHVGVTTDPITYGIERGHIKRFAEAIEDPNPLWQDEAQARRTRNGGVVTPPTFLRFCEARELKSVKLPGRALDASSEWEYFQSVRPGDRITVVRKVVDYTEKEGRLGKMLFERLENTFTNQFGEVVVKETSIGIYY